MPSDSRPRVAPEGDDLGPQVDILADPAWQMTHGDRVALEGVLSRVKPRLSIEIGTAQGGSLRRIAAHSAEVHSLDMNFEMLAERAPNVTFHEGDSTSVLPALLERLAAEGRNVDFALVDGDHRSEGVEADLRALLASPAVGRTVIVIHDSFNPGVRAGIERCSLDSDPAVRHFDLDLIGGRVTLDAFDGELWGGFAIVLVDRAAGFELPAIRILHPLVDEILSPADAWETAVRAAPVIKSIRRPEVDATRFGRSRRVASRARRIAGHLRRSPPG